MLIQGLLEITLIVFVAAVRADEVINPTLPLQFSGTVDITAHLVDRTKDYPPWQRIIHFSYDYINKRALAVIEKGYEEGKTYIRRYDQKFEYMVQGQPYPECQRSYLGETMPAPELPRTAVYHGKEQIEGVECEHWVEDLGSNRVHIYVDTVRRLPLRLTDEQIMDAESVPLMTYDFRDIVTGEPDGGVFDLPEPYTHKTCERYIGGFPYLHIFHWYLRF